MNTASSYARAPLMQTPDPRAILAHFLLQVQSGHVRTLRQHPVPLHFDSETQSVVAYPWPLHPVTLERLTPCLFEAFRRTHDLRGPSCFCAFLEHKEYTESRIGIAEAMSSTDGGRNHSVLHGEYVATCAKQRCGYFLCVERFYPIRDLKLQKIRERAHPLQPQELTHPIDIDRSFRAGDGLFQVMSDIVVRGKKNALEMSDPGVGRRKRDALMRGLTVGMSESAFWATFVQCLVCKDVMFRATMTTGSHSCKIMGRRVVGRHRPYARSRDEALSGRQSSRLSPTPTEIIDEDEDDIIADADSEASAGYFTLTDTSGSEGGELGDEIENNYRFMEDDLSDSEIQAHTELSSDGIPPLDDSDWEPPSVLSLFEITNQENGAPAAPAIEYDGSEDNQQHLSAAGFAQSSMRGEDLEA